LEKKRVWMLITKKVEVRWNANNKKHYTAREYDFTKYNAFFMAKIEDVPHGSEVLVEVECDYCHTIFTKTYYKYHRHRKNSLIKTDCCVKCRHIKNREIYNLKYGVDNPMQLKRVQNKVAQTNIELYGAPYYAQTDEWKERFTGKNSPTWKGGLTSEYRRLRNSTEQKDWKLNVFQRDGFTCVRCGCSKSGSLNAHHILNFAEHFHLINDIDNGITLCVDCHRGFHSQYGNTNNNQNQLNEFLNYKQDVETIETTA